jgi:hypothetical protein
MQILPVEQFLHADGHTNKQSNRKSQGQLDMTNPIVQCFSTFVRPRPGKFFYHKTRARSQQIYSSVTFHFF